MDQGLSLLASASKQLSQALSRPSSLAPAGSLFGGAAKVPLACAWAKGARRLRIPPAPRPGAGRRGDETRRIQRRVRRKRGPAALGAREPEPRDRQAPGRMVGGDNEPPSTSCYAPRSYQGLRQWDLASKCERVLRITLNVRSSFLDLGMRHSVPIRRLRLSSNILTKTFYVLFLQDSRRRFLGFTKSLSSEPCSSQRVKTEPLRGSLFNNDLSISWRD